MRAVVETHHGGPDVLDLTHVREPELTPDGIRIQVVAAGVNRADVLQRTGNYKVPRGASNIFGLEVSGIVTELGPQVRSSTGVQIGQEVCALLDSGGYAQEVVAPAGNVLPAPTGTSLEDAAALPEVLATVWSNIFMEARAQNGETILIHGGSGGIGSAAIQICTAKGLRAMATVGSAVKADYVRSLGAEPIRYDQEDFLQRVQELTEGRGADVILDVVGAKYLDQNLKGLATDGRLVVIGLQGGRTAQIDLARLMGRRLHLIGTTLRARSAEQKREIMAQVHRHLWSLVESGEIKIRVDRIFPLGQVAEAHRYFDSGSHMGKVLLKP